MDLMWRQVGPRRGLWECELPDGSIPGWVEEDSPGCWRGYLSVGVETRRDYGDRVEAQAAVEALLAAGARPTPRPAPPPERKQWRPVANEPDPGRRSW